MPVDITKLPEWHSKRVAMETIQAKQEAYVEARLDGLGRRDAADKAGFSPSVGRKPIRLIETAELRAQMQKAMRKKGCGLSRIAETVSNALKANVSASFEGDVRESAVPDHKVRVGAAKLAADLMGVTRPDVAAGAQTAIVINLPGAAAKWFGSAE